MFSRQIDVAAECEIATSQVSIVYQTVSMVISERFSPLSNHSDVFC